MKYILIVTIFLYSSKILPAQLKRPFCVTGYYAGNAEKLDSFPVEKLTHLIFSFGHLRGHQLHINSAADTACIQKMVSFKKRYPHLKVILSLGGWGGCATCSEVFANEAGRNGFAVSVKKLATYFQTDGIDLDWEYPAIEGYPGHQYTGDDRKNFTLLIQTLRRVLGKKQEISFAAGGFDQFIDSSVDWNNVMQIADKVYIMSYDLVHGFSKVSGHHTPLFSTPQQKQSADNAVNKLLKAGVPPHKVVIGAAFYGRMFQVDDTLNRGLYRSCNFYRGVSYSLLQDSLNTAKGFMQYRDSVARAPYAFNAERRILVTYDDPQSVKEKTEYVIQKKLGGIMFWQLADDKTKNGLLDVIHETAYKKE